MGVGYAENTEGGGLRWTSGGLEAHLSRAFLLIVLAFVGPDLSGDRKPHDVLIYAILTSSYAL